MHVVSVFIHEFSIQDIKHNGKPDILGIYRAPNETLLKNVELILISWVSGFTLMHLIEKGLHEQNHSFIMYIQIIDLMITFATRPYVYFSQIIKLRSEIQKNLYSLYFVQIEYRA